MDVHVATRCAAAMNFVLCCLDSNSLWFLYLSDCWLVCSIGYMMHVGMQVSAAPAHWCGGAVVE